MKSLEKIVVKLLLKSVEGKSDTYQFAYKQNHSTEDAVVTLLHLILKHLDKPKTIAQALFLDFNYTFNTKQRSHRHLSIYKTTLVQSVNYV